MTHDTAPAPSAVDGPTVPNATVPDPIVPDMTRPGVGLVALNRWRADDPAHQVRLARASLDAWQALPWPAGLLGHHVALGADGDVVLNYSQWSDGAALERFSADGLAERAAWVQERGGEVDRLSSLRLRRYRTMRGPRGDEATGCLVLVSFATQTAGQQVALVDGIIHNATTQQPLSPGMLASHFHVSLDGTRVVNVVEFTSADAHQRVVEGSLPGSPVMHFILAQPEVEALGFERFEPFGTVAAPV